MLYYLSLAAAILAGVAGQLLLKAGAEGASGTMAQLMRLPTIVGLGFYAGAALLYIIALRRIPVSVAFPSVSLSYVVVALIGYLAWGEPLGWQQGAALVLICGGVALLYHA